MATEFRILDARQTESKSFRSRYSKAHKRAEKGSTGKLKYCANMLVGKSSAYVWRVADGPPRESQIYYEPERVVEVEAHRPFQMGPVDHHSSEDKYDLFSCFSRSVGV